MLWIKAFHIISMVTWFAGLFYLPRLFVYHADSSDRISLERFSIMEKRLSIIMSIGAVLTLVFGFWLLGTYGGAWVKLNAWIHVKIFLVLLLLGYHGWCQITVKRFREQRNQRSAKFYRLMNEVPAAFLVAIVLLAVLKPSF